MARVRNQPPPGDQQFLREISDLGGERLDDYQTFQDYYDGEQKTRLTDRAKKYLQASGFRFSENFCETVIDVYAERLVVVGFTSNLVEKADGEEIDPLGDTIGDWWERDKMDALQDLVHTTTFTKGDAFLVADWNQQRDRPRWAFNKPDLIRPFYTDDDEIDFAVKKWRSRAKGPQNKQGRWIIRLNVYWPDRVEKYFRRSKDEGQWERWQDPGDTAWPLPWLDSTGDPLGVPVFHFRNKPLGNEYGRSELRPVIPQQDELNKLILDLNLFADNLAVPQDWATGVTGDSVAFKRAFDVWRADSPEAKFGRLEAGDGSSLLEAVEQVLSRMARRSRTPMHLLTGGDMPSGESLKAAEAGLVAKAEKAQVWLGNTWEQAMLYGAHLATVFGDLSVPDDEIVLKAQWKDTESRNEEAQLSSALLKQQLGVSKATLLAELGYDPEEEAERRKAENEEAAEAMARMLDRGEPLE